MAGNGWQRSELSQALAEDLQTDWVPDAVAGLGLLPSEEVPEAGTGTLTVAVRDGERSMPLSTLEFRSWAQLEVDSALGALEERLCNQVFGYRDASTTYRHEWGRLQARLHRWRTDGRKLARFDIHRFFESVRIDSFADSLPAPIVSTMRRSEDLHATPLLPGHRWARRIANVLLSPVDLRLSHPFVRWQDDYWLAADSDEELTAAANALHAALATVGLRARRVPDRPLQVRSRATAPAARLTAARASGDLAQMKLALRVLAEQRDPTALSQVTDIANLYPALLPRIAMYLARLQDRAESVALLADMLGEANLWGRVRLIAAASANFQAAAQVGSDVLEELASQTAWSVRGLAARVQRMQGRTRVSAGPRLDALLADLSDRELITYSPIVNTTL